MGQSIVESLGVASPWIFVGTLAAVASCETMRPRFDLKLSLGRRWSAHFLLFLAIVTLRRLMPGVGAVAIAMAVRSSPYGLLNRGAVPFAVQIVLAIAGLDFVDYWRHRMYHSIPLLWRMHLLHHSDRDFDFSNGLRFHPFEVVASECIRWLFVAILAPPPIAVAITEICGGLITLVVHANVRLPAPVERLLRWAVFTPELHRIHHSLEEAAQQHNFGGTFVWWDRLFGTFQCADFNPGLEVGVREVSQAESERFSHILGAPFRRYDGATEPANAATRATHFSA